MSEEEKEALNSLKYLIDHGMKNLQPVMDLVNRLDVMTQMMSAQITSPITSPEWVRRYYDEEAKKYLCTK